VQEGDSVKELFLIGGTMGVGKISVCRELDEELPSSVADLQKI